MIAMWVGTNLERWRLLRNQTAVNPERTHARKGRHGQAACWIPQYWIPRTPLGLLASAIAAIALVAVGVVLFRPPPTSGDPNDTVADGSLLILMVFVVGSVCGLWIGTSLERRQTLLP